MDAEPESSSLLSHIEALRRALLWIIGVTAALYPVAYMAAPHAIRWLVHWSFPPEMGSLHYFSPMEVFWVQLKLAFILSLALAYPWNIWQIWRFMLPALYANERRALGWWILFSSVLFFGGMAFCIGLILPLLMRFASGFASAELRPMLGLASFLSLAGWLMLAFGLMFQMPVVVLLAVRFGVIGADSLAAKRPYVIVVILFAAAILTPPDVVSQVMLGLPSWLLFELGLLLARIMEKKSEDSK